MHFEGMHFQMAIFDHEHGYFISVGPLTRKNEKADHMRTALCVQPLVWSVKQSVGVDSDVARRLPAPAEMREKNRAASWNYKVPLKALPFDILIALFDFAVYMENLAEKK